MDYHIIFRGKRTVQGGADDAEHAARRAVMVQLVDDRIPYGASYEVSVNGENWIVDVAAQPGRGSVTARRAT